ncbi:hypothetical protein FGO68_gene5053 [Halteria grandinella]|uniref:Uncharacterized protein n=1 Tax=Halteria grandinella TaxID=5974 RepID=A0A8J8T2S9_HALGN|nr:hypothetical protein FGO68_gene5053 [Halteria grandinella]
MGDVQSCCGDDRFLKANKQFETNLMPSFIKYGRRDLRLNDPNLTAPIPSSNVTPSSKAQGRRRGQGGTANVSLDNDEQGENKVLNGKQQNNHILISEDYQQEDQELQHPERMRSESPDDYQHMKDYQATENISIGDLLNNSHQIIQEATSDRTNENYKNQSAYLKSADKNQTNHFNFDFPHQNEAAQHTIQNSKSAIDKSLSNEPTFGQSPREGSRCDFSPEKFEFSLKQQLDKVAQRYQQYVQPSCSQLENFVSMKKSSQQLNTHESALKTSKTTTKVRKTVDSRQHLDESDKDRQSVISYSSGRMHNKFRKEPVPIVEVFLPHSQSEVQKIEQDSIIIVRVQNSEDQIGSEEMQDSTPAVSKIQNERYSNYTSIRRLDPSNSQGSDGQDGTFKRSQSQAISGGSTVRRRNFSLKKSESGGQSQNDGNSILIRVNPNEASNKSSQNETQIIALPLSEGGSFDDVQQFSARNHQIKESNKKNDQMTPSGVSKDIYTPLGIFSGKAKALAPRQYK